MKLADWPKRRQLIQYKPPSCEGEQKEKDGRNTSNMVRINRRSATTNLRIALTEFVAASELHDDGVCGGEASEGGRGKGVSMLWVRGEGGVGWTYSHA